MQYTEEPQTVYNIHSISLRHISLSLAINPQEGSVSFWRRFMSPQYYRSSEPIASLLADPIVPQYARSEAGEAAVAQYCASLRHRRLKRVRLLEAIVTYLRCYWIRKASLGQKLELCTHYVTHLYPQKLALTSPTSGGLSVVIVRSRIKATELFSWLVLSEFFMPVDAVFTSQSHRRRCLVAT
jgi:hypothetical protein